MDLPPFALERYFAPREFTARAQLSCSDCEPLSLAEVLTGADDESRALWASLSLGYVETRGTPLLRAEIAALYHGVNVDDVLTCAPAEGILLAMSALLSAGDRVVVAMPAYQSLYSIAAALGCAVVPWRAREGDRWRFDVDELRALVDGRAAMIVVNAPHNPTGALHTHEEWRAIVDVARSAGAWLFADEMYRLLEDGSARLPSAVEAYERGITLGGLSKAFGAPGLRSGWLALRDRAALDVIAARKDYTTICGSAPSEALAVMVLRRCAELTARNRALVAAGRAAVDALVCARPDLLAACAPGAGCTALARLGDAVPSAAALCDRLFADTGILLLPSTVFDWGDRHVRLGLGRAGFPAALADFGAWADRQTSTT